MKYRNRTVAHWRSVSSPSGWRRPNAVRERNLRGARTSLSDAYGRWQVAPVMSRLIRVRNNQCLRGRFRWLHVCCVTAPTIDVGDSKPETTGAVSNTTHWHMVPGTAVIRCHFATRSQPSRRCYGFSGRVANQIARAASARSSCRARSTTVIGTGPYRHAVARRQLRVSARLWRRCWSLAARGWFARSFAREGLRSPVAQCDRRTCTSE